MTKYKPKYGPKLNCEHRVLDYNPETGRLWHPPYCVHSLEPQARGKIECPYVGSCIELTITEQYNESRKTVVNVCDLADRVDSKPKKNWLVCLLSREIKIFGRKK